MSTLTPADFYGDQQRYKIAAGKMIKFYPPPTPSYKITTTGNSMGAKGTLVELLPQPTTAATASDATWDTYPNQPLYAARYENPLVKKESRTVYWEIELDTDTSDGDDIKQQGEISIGFVAKDTLRKEHMQASVASGSDPRLHHSPSEHTIAVGPSLLINASTGEAYADGTNIPVEHPIKPSVRTIGIGITFAFDPSALPPVDEDKKEKGFFKRIIERHSSPPVACATPEELRSVPVAVFLAVDGDMVGVDVSGVDMVGLGFDGTRDVYPALMVKGDGVHAILKMGECVEWDGEGGSGDGRIKGLGNRAKPGFKAPSWPFQTSNAYGYWAVC